MLGLLQRLGIWPFALALLWSTAGFAHQTSDGFLSLNLEERILRGQWDIALRDLEHALAVDINGDGAITWGELKTRSRDIQDYAFARLRLTAAGRACVIEPEDLRVDRHGKNAYAVLRFTSDCSATDSLKLDYRLFFDLDSSHRGLLRVTDGDLTYSDVLSPKNPQTELDVTHLEARTRFGAYWKEGFRHIWIGIDHLLFLLTLLMPSVLRRVPEHRYRQSTLVAVLRDVAGLVTAFTVAHSLTLSVAVMGWVNPPSRWVETAIAATVLVAAVNNLYPRVRGRRVALAFGLGLVHGFGFAGVLTELGLTGGPLAMALVGFNLGVEAGQLVFVALCLPLAYRMRESWFYRRIIVQLGSLTVAVVAVMWLAERSMKLSQRIL
jgi:hypothetical protein